MRNSTGDNYSERLDDAARAGWLYYIAGYKQDEIARTMGVSRQTAQRLVAMALREKLIRIRLEHPIMRCMELADRLTRAFGLEACDVVPSAPGETSPVAGLAEAGARAMERELSAVRGRVIAVGTGRTLRACVEELTPMNRPDHTVVALLGHMMPGGLSTRFNVVVRLADRINAGHYPMPLPIYARSAREREVYRELDTVKQIHRLAREAEVTFVGLGNIGPDAPLLVDGLMSQKEVDSYIAAGAVGEMTGWIFNAEGRLIEGLANDRVNSVPLTRRKGRRVYCLAAGSSRVTAIRAALRGRLVNCLITNEATAEEILALSGL
ncbi:sugar-binding transcriptional regulator [Nitratireductor aquimarinus]|uniref:sugar-binding transcriptional regulator n=1 Tax=Alphaproteobacteria TaxID=28211 RepID=UPI000DE10DA4|nr:MULTISPECIES: sugar-binding transcriptional regulator [Alphaproteobacteria]MBY6022933.1 sugar-binding transcriptional regulator [Nitratireductor sp. DP7N14-4]MBN7758140.1 sugar-binding transcriptional regulator [Nitratireductor aquimarinus]MBN7776271.1 sugar-binding transcriptional regulator [Nitratireductor pacificus]MBN7779138.1 sugar-binding transcriptional regulator [Nitratireductor pacificus]MBN7787945.1 sugar-binding transcriptional regulator [Nitratireductor aquimarinus]